MKTAVEQSPCGRFIRYDDMLGKGSFKKVYYGFDRVEDIHVAWNKVVFQGEEALESTPETLFSEPIFLRSLNHEKIMKCFSYWFDSKSKTLNMITELFLMGSLKEHLEYDGSSTAGAELSNIKNWGRQILEGLRFLHAQSPKIIHRDIKCGNVFLHSGGKQIKLGDFGLTFSLNMGEFGKKITGTPEFMAPDYYDEEYNELVDIYAFGMCLLEMVSGEYPYTECSNFVHIYKRVKAGVKPAALGKVEDSRLKDIIEKCLLPKSVRPSAEELLKDPFFESNGGSTMEASTPTPRFENSKSKQGKSKLTNCKSSFGGLHCFDKFLKHLCLV